MWVPKGTKQFEVRLDFDDGCILRMRVWELPQPVPPSEHRFKYSLSYGRQGERLLLYDNERGKGDHRHYGKREEPYEFKDVETLRSDFLADVRRLREGR